MQAEALGAFISHARRRPIHVMPEAAAVRIGREEIERILQHRPPFLFVDAVEAIDLAAAAIAGRRRIDPDDPLFEGHFPGAPIYPGVLQVETMGQLGLCLLYFNAAARRDVATDAVPRPVRALRIHHAMFLEAVYPGDEMSILATLIEADEYVAICGGQLLVGEKIVAFAVMEVYLVEQE